MTLRARISRVIVLAPLLLTLITGAMGFVASKPVHAAKTIVSMPIYDFGKKRGQIDLRWSRACQANWGRFSLYPMKSLDAIFTSIVAVKITAWNPGQPSYDTAPSSNDIDGTWWSMMTDGTKKACTGVQVLYSFSIDGGYSYDSDMGEWHWGPCY